MIPNTLNLVSSSPLKKHANYNLPVFTVSTLEDFLSLKSEVKIFQFPSPHKIESPTNSDTMTADSGSPNEAGKEEANCTVAFQQLDKESFMRDKQEILIPMKKEISKNTVGMNLEGDKLSKQRKIQSHYIRYDYLSAEPRTDSYEATNIDLTFLDELNKEFSNDCNLLDRTLNVSQAKFERIVEMWEHETGEGLMISLQQAFHVLAKHLDNNIPNETIEKIYGHWKSSREQFRRPLLRKYWRAAHKEEFNPNVAFQKRKENKFARRRSHRMSSPQDDLKRMKTLKKNMDKCLVLLANTKYREILKFELQDTKRRQFEEQLKNELGNDINIVNTSNLGTGTHYDNYHYHEIKKDMVEYSRKGETILQSINRLKDRKSSGKSLKKKLLPTQPSTSIDLLSPQADTIKPTPTSISHSKFISLLPKSINGSFTIPIRKSSIEVNDLKEKLKLSLGGLYLRNQEELRVKVELNETKDKVEEKENFNINTNKMFNKSEEHLIIKIDLKEQLKVRKEGRILESTAVKYNIIFHNSNEDQKSPLEIIKKKIKTSEPVLELDPNLSAKS